MLIILVIQLSCDMGFQLLSLLITLLLVKLSREQTINCEIISQNTFIATLGFSNNSQFLRTVIHVGTILTSYQKLYSFSTTRYNWLMGLLLHTSYQASLLLLHNYPRSSNPHSRIPPRTSIRDIKSPFPCCPETTQVSEMRTALFAVHLHFQPNGRVWTSLFARPLCIRMHQ
jgi:hypothetical protein